MCKVVVKKNFAFTISWAPSPPGGEAAAVAWYLLGICLYLFGICLVLAWYWLGICFQIVNQSETQPVYTLSNSDFKLLCFWFGSFVNVSLHVFAIFFYWTRFPFPCSDRFPNEVFLALFFKAVFSLRLQALFGLKKFYFLSWSWFLTVFSGPFKIKRGPSGGHFAVSGRSKSSTPITL